MSYKTDIEWTGATWNPATGCDKVSAGCKECYAERGAARLHVMKNRRYDNGFELTLHPDKLGEPLRWRKPRRIFVCSMSDLFHERVPEDFIFRVFETMVRAHWHTFQILTKRDERLAALSSRLPWPSNIWAGVSIENANYLRRVDSLRDVAAAIRFLSLEPLLGPLPKISLPGIHWVICGGESGPKHRPIKAEWVRDIREQCIAAGVPFFFKQWGGHTPKAGGRLLDGRTWEQYAENNLTALRGSNIRRNGASFKMSELHK